MIRAAAGYIVRNGPATQQDRWEEDGGYSAFTIAVEISALLAAADAMEAAGQDSIARYLTETADGWNEQIDDWAYARDTEISRKLGIDGYYMRIGFSSGDANARSHGLIPIKNRSDGNEALEAGLLISPDALALVRFGLRAADDPRILNTVKAIDSLLRRELPAGSYWYRYNDDGYGEHADGAPFDGAGIGRLWPLLTGERAHYELAAGRPQEARRLLAALEASASTGGLLPEQIWDSDDIPRRELFLGRPSGSAMPLVWAHAEHIKLLRSLRDNAVFDMPPQTLDRYVKNTPPPAPIVWRPTVESRPHRAGPRPAAGISGAGADTLVDRQLENHFRQRRGRDRPRHCIFSICRRNGLTATEPSFASPCSGQSKTAGKAPTSRSRSPARLERQPHPAIRTGWIIDDMSAQRDIRLLLADVDGTLVTQDKVLTDQAVAAAQELHEAGITLALTSGRPPRGMSMLIAPLKLEGAIAGFNGGVFVHPDLSVIESHLLDFGDRQGDAAADSRSGPRRLGLYRKGVADPRRQGAACGARDLDREIRRQGREFVHRRASGGRGQDRRRLRRSRSGRGLREVWRSKNWETSASAARSQPYYLDVTNPQANKGAVVLTLAKLQNISPEQIATIGDMPNDVLMFRKSGLSIAMGNASDEVKSQATAVTDSNQNEGFAKAVRKFILRV